MKLKEIYSLNKCSNGLSHPLIKKTLLSRVFYSLVFLFTVLFSIELHSQEIAISGIENIHLSEGVIIVTKKSDGKITFVDAESIKSYSKTSFNKTEKKQNISKKKNTSDYKHKKTSPKTTKKAPKLNSKVFSTLTIYDLNSDPKTSFRISDIILRQVNTNENNYNFSFLKENHQWITHPDYFIKSTNFSYIFFYSKKINTSLFTRPPPRIS